MLKARLVLQNSLAESTPLPRNSTDGDRKEAKHALETLPEKTGQERRRGEGRRGEGRGGEERGERGRGGQERKGEDKEGSLMSDFSGGLNFF